MKNTSFTPFALPVALGLLLGVAPSLPGAIVLDESFTSFALGNLWQSHGAGAPNLALNVVGGIGTDGSSLRMGSSAGAAGETVGKQCPGSMKMWVPPQPLRTSAIT